ncbi:MAG: hypothetical protein COW13_01160 [Candidatus Omnitrophica bacterium CG12_big_fil_rev_8_21_14_0_65_50_5]|nr:MAG: hypothetical protein COW13_01160 [Candidatus Omnitrophica bacterium CG12_big_fil_rev_8_21_14_0_65_50_5]
MEGAHYNWNKALGLDPNNLDTKISLAVVQLKRGQITSAQNALQQVLKVDPQNPQALTHLGTVAYVKKDFPGAISSYQNALQLVQSGGGDAETRSKNKALLADIYGGLGMSLWQLGNTQEATKYFSAACGMSPSVACHEKMGKIYYEIGQWDNAISELVQVLQTNKENTELYGVIGMAFTKKGEIENAISAFQEGLRYAKDQKKISRLHSNSGHLYLQMQRAEPAVSEFMAAITSDWSNQDAHLGLALAYLSKGEPAQARSSLVNLLGMNPQNQQARDLLGQVETMLNELQNQQVSVSFS